VLKINNSLLYSVEMRIIDKSTSSPKPELLMLYKVGPK